MTVETNNTIEAERLITEAMRLNGLLATFERDVGRKTTIEAFNLLGSLALLLRASEEARVKAERERDDLLCRIHRDGGHYISEHGIEKACQDADVIVATLNVQKDEAETALADMRRERDASDAALLWFSTRRVDLRGLLVIVDEVPDDLEDAITAARSRKPDGEEKKL